MRFNRVADGVNVGIGGPHLVVHPDAAAGTDGQSGLDRQLIVGSDADAEHHHVGAERLAASQPHGDAVARRLDGFGGVAQLERDAPVAQMLGDRRNHLGVPRGQDLIGQFDDRRGDVTVNQILRHLESDEACADHDDLHLLQRPSPRLPCPWWNG